MSSPSQLWCGAAFLFPGLSAYISIPFEKRALLSVIGGNAQLLLMLASWVGWAERLNGCVVLDRGHSGREWGKAQGTCCAHPGSWHAGHAHHRCVTALRLYCIAGLLIFLALIICLLVNISTHVELTCTWRMQLGGTTHAVPLVCILRCVISLVPSADIPSSARAAGEAGAWRSKHSGRASRARAFQAGASELGAAPSARHKENQVPASAVPRLRESRLGESPRASSKGDVHFQ